MPQTVNWQAHHAAHAAGAGRAGWGLRGDRGARYVRLDEPVLRVGAVLEASGAHEGRTGRDHLRALCLAAGLPASRADEVLAAVGLAQAGGRRVRAYSLGMRQRLGVAAALLGTRRC